MRSYFYEIQFHNESLVSERDAFIDDLMGLLEEHGFVAGGAYDASEADLAIDTHADDDSSKHIEEHIQSVCGKYSCIARWKRKRESNRDASSFRKPPD